MKEFVDLNQYKTTESRYKESALLCDLLSVQPMSEPTGLIYYLRYRYSNTQNKSHEPPEESIWEGIY